MRKVTTIVIEKCGPQFQIFEGVRPKFWLFWTKPKEMKVNRVVPRKFTFGISRRVSFLCGDWLVLPSVGSFRFTPVLVRFLRQFPLAGLCHGVAEAEKFLKIRKLNA